MVESAAGETGVLRGPEGRIIASRVALTSGWKQPGRLTAAFDAGAAAGLACLPGLIEGFRDSSALAVPVVPTADGRFRGYGGRPLDPRLWEIIQNSAGRGLPLLHCCTMRGAPIVSPAYHR